MWSNGLGDMAHSCWCGPLNSQTLLIPFLYKFFRQPFFLFAVRLTSKIQSVPTLVSVTNLFSRQFSQFPSADLLVHVLACG